MHPAVQKSACTKTLLCRQSFCISGKSNCRQQYWGRGTLWPRDTVTTGASAQHSQWQPSCCPQAQEWTGGSGPLGRAARGLPQGPGELNPFSVSCSVTEDDSLALRSVTQEGNELHGKNDSWHKYYSVALHCPCELCSCGLARRQGDGLGRRGGYQEQFNPLSSRGLIQTPARADNYCRQHGHTLQPRCSSSRHSWPGQWREYVSSHCWCLFQDCKRYKFVSVTVILAGERGSSIMLFYTYIIWTPTESY